MWGGGGEEVERETDRQIDSETESKAETGNVHINQMSRKRWRMKAKREKREIRGRYSKWGGKEKEESEKEIERGSMG